MLANRMGIAVADADGRLLEVNPRLCGMLGRSEAELLTLSCADLTHPDDWICNRLMIEQVAAGERPEFIIEKRYRCGDGRWIWVNVSVVPLCDEAGVVRRLLAVIEDIDARKQAEAQLEAELADSQLLQGISAELIEEDDVDALYEKIVNAASAIMRSECSSMQRLYPERGAAGELKLLASRGLSAEARRCWEWVHTKSQCTCGHALKTGARAIAADVRHCEWMEGSDDQANLLKSGIQAAQSTPLVSRSGKLLGMISTHWRQPHEPSERDLRLLDILARQAADLLERHQADEQFREHERRLRASEQQLRAIIETTPECVKLVAADGTLQQMNPAGLEMVEAESADTVAGKSIYSVIAPEHRESFREFNEAVCGGRSGMLEFDIIGLRGTRRHMETQAVPLVNPDGRVSQLALTRDVTERKRQEKLESAQRRVLELITADAPLAEVLESLVRSIEEQSDSGLLASVLLLDPVGRRLRHGAAPSLPAAYNRAIDGVAIGPCVGSCGTAAYLGQPVHVSDIATDPLWAEFCELALSHGLAACSSTPIFSRDGEVLGTFAVYYRQPRVVDERDLQLIDTMSRTASIAIERKLAQDALRESEERFRAFTNTTFDVVYRMSADWLELRQLRGQEFIADTLEPSRSWIDAYIHPDDQKLVWDTIQDAIANKTVFELEHRVIRVDGTLGWTHSRAIPLLNDQGEIEEWFGAATDVTVRREALEAQKRNAETFAALIEQSPLGIYVVDSQFRIAIVSAGSEPAFRNVQPVIGRDFGEVMHTIWPPSFANEAIAIFRHTLETGEPYVSPGLTETRKDVGDVESYEWQVNRVMLADGQYGAVCYYFDTTRLQQAAQALRDSEERFRMLADNMDQLAWTCDELGNVTWYNQRWLDYTGLTFEEMRDWGWKAVHHPDHVDRVVASVTHSRNSGEVWDDTFPLRGRDGEYRWFLSRAIPIRDADGNIVRWFGTNTDVTELRALQESLRDADRRKDEFLATLAHELRNPLAPIRTGLELMRLIQDEPEAMEETRATMERQTQQLITLVDDLLDVSRITRGKLDLRKCRVSLSDVIQSAVEASRPFIDDAGHQLTVVPCDSQIHLDADPHRLAQVVSNLLNNASKYTPDGGRIRLSCESSNGSVAISVEDNGIGIPADMRDCIFEMFAQIDRPMEKGYTGLGIGLTLVKRLVEMHGGSIDVHSEGAGQGSRFRVTLPIVQEPAVVPDEPVTAPEGEGTGLRVLVVDDSQPAADMLGKVVRMLGNEVRIAYDGLQAVEAAAEYRPDIILMDLGMPRMTGYEAARRIREYAWGGDITMVALTGWGQESDRQRTADAGFDRHLVKPADPAQLQRLFSESARVDA